MHSRISDAPEQEPTQKKSRVSEPTSALRGNRQIMSQAQLRSFFEKNNHPQVANSDSSFQYHRAKPHLTRWESFIVHVDKKNHDVMEIYVPSKTINHGASGFLRLFTSVTNPQKKLAVKQRLFKNNKPECGGGILKRAITQVKEAEFMQRAHPDSDVQVTHYVVNEKYDYRFIMPFIEGVDFADMLDKVINMHDLFLLILAIAKEINRIHSLGIAHEDLNDGNIICNEIINKETGRKDYSVKCIDFGTSSRILEGHDNNIESDIDALADFVQKGLDKFSMQEETPAYACLNEFNLSLLDSGTKQRPTIQDFIMKLTDKLAETNVRIPNKRFTTK